MLLSKIVFHWVSGLPTTNCKFKFQQPRTLVQYVRTLFGRFKDRFDWDYSFDNDFNFDGGLVPMLNKLFNDRRKQVGVGYGAANNVPKLVASAGGNGGNGKPVNVRSMDFSVFDPNDPVEATQQMMLGCGAFLGFRGVDEHAKLERKHWVREVFDQGHPYAGEEYYGLENMPDKTNKLSASNPVVKNNVGMRVPVDSDFGRIITNYFSKLSPGQVFKNMGHPKALFSPNQPLGV